MQDIEQYLQQQIATDAYYRVRVIDWTLRSSTSTLSKGIAYKLQVIQHWAPEHNQWSQEYGVGYYTEHTSWVVGQDGKTLNERAIEALRDVGLWNGDWDAIGGPPPETVFIVEVKGEDYKGKMQWRGDWPQVNAAEPVIRTGGYAPVKGDLIADMRAQFGSATRAIAGGAPTGPVPTPPTAGVAQQVAQPVAQQVVQQVLQPAAQQVAQPVAQQVAQPMQVQQVQRVEQAAPVQQPQMYPAGSQPAAQPVAQPGIQPLAQPVVQQVVQHPPATAQPGVTPVGEQWPGGVVQPPVAGQVTPPAAGGVQDPGPQTFDDTPF